MKKNGLIFIGLMIVLFICSGLFAEPIGTQNMLVVFDGRANSSFNSINLVAVAGWSADGKVAVYQPGSDYSPSWFIQDTITDKIIEESNSGYGAEEQEELAAFKQAMQKHNISSKTGSLVSLPYNYPSNLPPLRIEYGSLEGMGDSADVYAVRGNKKKKITSVYPVGNMPSIDGAYAVKSPFEDRLLVIIQTSGAHIEFDYKMTGFTFAGCHLTAGF